MLDGRQPRSLRACSRDDPECGARRGVLRRRLVTVRPGRQGLRPPGTKTWVRGARCNRSGANAGERSAAPEPKTATVERREASVPRHGTQGASQAPGTPRYGVLTGVPPSTRTFLGAPPTPRFGVSEAKSQTPGRKNAPRERGSACWLRSWAVMLVLILRSADAKRFGKLERACARLEG
jgi:hypothetical protein